MYDACRAAALRLRHVAVARPLFAFLRISDFSRVSRPFLSSV